MTADEQEETDRAQAFDAVVEETAAVKREVDSTLPDLWRRLDELSRDLRERGAFPVAGQIDRHRITRGEGAR